MKYSQPKQWPARIRDKVDCWEIRTKIWCILIKINILSLISIEIFNIQIDFRKGMHLLFV